MTGPDPGGGRAPLVPMATYRVQVRPDFDLNAATGIVGYIARLGVTHLYSAPLLTATPGSAHGYDVVDPTKVNPELGGPAALDRLVATLRAEDLGLVADIVPNHLGVARPKVNPAWWSVLRDGPDSPYAAWFDIDWSRGPLLIPVLGDDSLDGVTVHHGDDGDDELRYYEHRYPIAAGTADGSVADVHVRQHYRLVNWRRANTELTYRRFFAIADLAGVRVEDPAVFAATHTEILRWVADGLVDGLRVDHPDGLRDPGDYLRRLHEAAPATWLVAEKILEYGEQMPVDWPVAGTSGYDALREVCGLFVDPAGVKDFPADVPFLDAALEGKREAAVKLLAAELNRLINLAPQHPKVRGAIAGTAVHLDVYRTYLPDGRDRLDRALDTAAATFADGVSAIAPVITDPQTELAQRFQQYSGAVMAKGVEDTAYYRWTRFIALNEVGGAPDRFGVPPDEFHAAALRRVREWPHGMTTLSTHDTKRSEDVRARLAVLSEIGPRWQAAFARWTAAAPLDDPDLAALIWQTAIGAWPIEPERLHAYVEKAAREASTHTTWTDPDEDFERAMHAVVDAMYGDLHPSIDRFVDGIVGAGWSNALGQKLIQLTMPGVPDTYQGTELWDNSLVDPDNRRPVDFDARASMLDRLDNGWQPPVDRSGAAKLLVTSRALRLRRDHSDLFTDYRPLLASGPHAPHMVGFDRGGALTVVTRLPVRLATDGGWTTDDTVSVPGGRWRDVLTGSDFDGPTIGLDRLLASLPVALLAPAERIESAERPEEERTAA
jgi:(1->4)-alpha-D-glucan 1-alpha-D-glucosylmutase